MRNRMTVLVMIVFVTVFLLSTIVWGQTQPAQPSAQPSMPGMDIGNDTEKGADSEASAHAMHSMEGHMDMGPHMKMTALRPSKPGDAERAQQVVEAARQASEKYTDYHVALADGFKIFHPEIPQKMYHFTSVKYAWENARNFNPEHPTSLLYEKHGDDYKLVGVMYTAPKRLTEEQLDQRVPLSVAQWHEHVNFCIPPLGHFKEMRDPHPQFGFKGSIATQEACDAAGGTFFPVVFNWMVHVYPFEKDQANVWSVERQHGDAD